MSNQLAPVHWQLGQTLRPAHLEAQELSLLTNSKLRFDALGKPYYGVLQLSFDESDILENSIRLTVFSYVLESGELIQLGGNAIMLQNIEQAQLAKDKSRVELYINIYKQLSVSTSASTCMSASKSYKPLLPEPVVTVLDEVEKQYYQLELLVLPKAEAATDITLDQHLQLVAQVKLVELIKDNGKNWQFNEKYLPPLLLLDRVPLFQSYSTKIKTYIDAFQQELESCFTVELKQDNPWRYAQISQLLGDIYQCQQIIDYLRDELSEISLHPFELFAALQQLYTQVQLYRNTLPEQFQRPYRHRNRYRHKQLGETFTMLIESLKQVIYLKEFNYKHLPLIEQNGIYSTILQVPDQARVYLAVHNENNEALTVFEPPVRASSRQQVPYLNTHVVPGVEFIKIINDAVIDRLNEELKPYCPTIYFEILKKDQWLLVVQDKSFGFYGQNEYRNCKFFLVIESSSNAIAT